MRNETGVRPQIPRACNRDCSLIYGSGHTDFDPGHPHVGEAWIWQGNKNVQYLGTLENTLVSRDAFRIADATASGDMVVGGYPSLFAPFVGDGVPTSRGWIWTQGTGMVSVRELITELGIGDDDWRTMVAADVSSSGNKVLLSGFHFVLGTGNTHNRAVILELEPKEGSK